MIFILYVNVGLQAAKFNNNDASFEINTEENAPASINCNNIFNSNNSNCPKQIEQFEK